MNAISCPQKKQDFWVLQIQRDINKAINFDSHCIHAHLSFTQLSSLSHLDLTIFWESQMEYSSQLVGMIFNVFLYLSRTWGSPGLDPRHWGDLQKTNKSVKEIEVPNWDMLASHGIKIQVNSFLVSRFAVEPPIGTCGDLAFRSAAKGWRQLSLNSETPASWDQVSFQRPEVYISFSSAEREPPHAANK